MITWVRSIRLKNSSRYRHFCYFTYALHVGCFHNGGFLHQLTQCSNDRLPTPCSSRASTGGNWRKASQSPNALESKLAIWNNWTTFKKRKKDVMSLAFFMLSQSMKDKLRDWTSSRNFLKIEGNKLGTDSPNPVERTGRLHHSCHSRRYSTHLCGTRATL